MMTNWVWMLFDKAEKEDGAKLQENDISDQSTSSTEPKRHRCECVVTFPCLFIGPTLAEA